MRFSHFFIDRPIFAAVLSIIITIAGVLVERALPISEYPEIAPPTVSIRATYPGASAQVLAETVATPIEQEVNGVDDMLYITSQSVGDGTLTIDVVFKPGVNVDTAQVLVQNRVSVATPRLPDDVQRLGVTVRKASPDLMMVVHMISPDGSRDQQYISNYATLYIKDALARVDGVGDVNVFGARDYSMRIWLDPGKVAARGLTADDVVASLRAANLQVAAGAINQPPAMSPGAFQLSVQTLGRLSDVEQFGNIVVRADPNGGYVRIRDIARVELGSQDYTVNAYLNKAAATAIVIYQRPGSNALTTAAAVKAAMAEAKKDFPSGLDYTVVYNPTEFIQQSINEVQRTLFEAIGLVVCVVILFLQTWRAAIIPVVAIPVSLVGCFLVMGLVGISFNTLSLFGLVLAIGIVVDDAIVVVENVERYIQQGHVTARCGAHDHGRGRQRADRDRAGAVRGVHPDRVHQRPARFVLSAVRHHHRRGHGHFRFCLADVVAGTGGAAAEAARRTSRSVPAFYRLGAPVRAFFAGFNWLFDRLSTGYGRLVARLVRVGVIVLVAYAGLIYLAYDRLAATPTGLIPQLDRGYLIAAFQLPPGASLARTDAVIRRASEIILARPGVQNSVAFTGFDGATFTNAPNAGVIFVPLKPFEERVPAGADRPPHSCRSAPAARAARRCVRVRAGTSIGARDRHGRRTEALRSGSRRTRAACARAGNMDCRRLGG